MGGKSRVIGLQGNAANLCEFRFKTLENYQGVLELGVI